jgi:hypothetical protein
MYEKPAVQRFGSLRDLTLVGVLANGDILAIGLGQVGTARS